MHHITTISSREFNHNVGKAKRAAANGPVYITDRGCPEYVLLTIEKYEEVTVKQKNIVELLADPNAGDIDFEPPRLDKLFHQPEDLS